MATNTKKAEKQINKAFGQINSMVDNLTNGIKKLYTKKQENNSAIENLKAENTAINIQIMDAENLKTSLENLKG